MRRRLQQLLRFVDCFVVGQLEVLVCFAPVDFAKSFAESSPQCRKKESGCFVEYALGDSVV